MPGFAFAIIVVPWVAALVAVYGMIKTLVTVAKARVRIFTASCERAFDKAVTTFEDMRYSHEARDKAASGDDDDEEERHRNKTRSMRRESRKQIIKQKFNDLQESVVQGGMSGEFVHLNVVCPPPPP